MEITESLKTTEKQVTIEIQSANSAEELEEIRIAFFGRKGKLTEILRSLSTIPKQDRGKVGKEANELKNRVQNLLTSRMEELKKDLFKNLKDDEWVDVTIPVTPGVGHLHPLTLTLERIEEIFTQVGFVVASGPEIEYDKYNFELLNLHKDHPARDTQDTFYFDAEVLLRTQTSPVQIRYMEKNDFPIRIIVPGKVYRRDYDLTHTPMFHQFEGLVVDKGITIEDLKGTLEFVMKSLLGSETKLRFRPHNFPFTEPSLEIDTTCAICNGEGCRTCKNTGWLEMAGAGMVHPQVLRNVGIDPEEVSGFAFGFGIDRIAMMRHGISDLRMMFENDYRFLSQF